MTPSARSRVEQPAPSRARWPRRLKLAALGCTCALLLGVGGMAAGIQHQAADAAYAGPRPLPAQVAGRFAYPERGHPARVLSEFRPEQGDGWSSRWLHLEVTTPGEDTPHRVQVIHFQPVGGPDTPRAGVVVTPILGGRRQLAELIGRRLALRGLHAAVVLKAESLFDASAPEARLERVLRTGVVDRRRAIDWLQAVPGVDPQRIGAIGVSMGGIATALLCAVEPRVRAGVMVLAGGDLGDVIARSDEPRIQRYVAEMGRGPDELRERIRQVLVDDPLALAPYVDARKVLLIQARFDTTVPYDEQERLWAAMGRPERYVLPTGHYTLAVYLPYALPAALDFLEARLR